MTALHTFFAHRAVPLNGRQQLLMEPPGCASLRVAASAGLAEAGPAVQARRPTRRRQTGRRSPWRSTRRASACRSWSPLPSGTARTWRCARLLPVTLVRPLPGVAACASARPLLHLRLPCMTCAWEGPPQRLQLPAEQGSSAAALALGCPSVPIQLNVGRMSRRSQQKRQPTCSAQAQAWRCRRRWCLSRSRASARQITSAWPAPGSSTAATWTTSPTICSSAPSTLRTRRSTTSRTSSAASTTPCPAWRAPTRWAPGAPVAACRSRSQGRCISMALAACGPRITLVCAAGQPSLPGQTRPTALQGWQQGVASSGRLPTA